MRVFGALMDYGLCALLLMFLGFSGPGIWMVMTMKKGSALCFIPTGALFHLLFSSFPSFVVGTSYAPSKDVVPTKA